MASSRHNNADIELTETATMCTKAVQVQARHNTNMKNKKLAQSSTCNQEAAGNCYLLRKVK